jgi:hypothetical protein
VTRALAEIRYKQATGEETCWVKRAYWCDFHHGWHLTKTDLKRGRVRSDVLVSDGDVAVKATSVAGTEAVALK